MQRHWMIISKGRASNMKHEHGHIDIKKLNETFLITEELLKQYSNMSRNVGVDKVIPYINLSQPFYITPILGEPLFEELQLQVYHNNLTPYNKALILKIAPALALWTDFLASRSLAYTISQKGIVKENSENSASLDKSELSYFTESIRENAERATHLLVEYLCKCREHYPKWMPQSECDCAKYEKGNGTSEVKHGYQIYFPGAKKTTCGGCK